MVCTEQLDDDDDNDNDNDNSNNKRSPQIPFSLSVLRAPGKAECWYPPGLDQCLPFTHTSTPLPILAVTVTS